MFVLKRVLEQIADTIGALRAESGGILAMDRDGVVADYYFDAEAGSGKTSYVPSRGTIQHHVVHQWFPAGLTFCGIVHSHPLCNTCEPSYVDINMAVKIMSVNNMDALYLLVVKGTEMQLYRVTTQNGQGVCEKEEICIKEEG